MECVNCEINLLKKNSKMNDYSKATVEVLDHMCEVSSMIFHHTFVTHAVDPLVEA